MLHPWNLFIMEQLQHILQNSEVYFFWKHVAFFIDKSSLQLVFSPPHLKKRRRWFSMFFVTHVAEPGQFFLQSSRHFFAEKPHILEDGGWDKWKLGDFYTIPQSTKQGLDQVLLISIQGRSQVNKPTLNLAFFSINYSCKMHANQLPWKKYPLTAHFSLIFYVLLP